MRIRTLLALLTTCLLLLASCADDGAGDAASPGAGEATETTETAEPTEEPTETPDDGTGATVAVADSKLGEILVDADGLTLYVFFADENGKSTCYGDCEASWPPLTVDGEPVAGDGVEASLLGTTERDEGTTQVTYDDQPLYLFASDQAPGDTNGQGVGDVWYVVAPDGTPIEHAHAGADSGGGGGAGYGSGDK